MIRAYGFNWNKTGSAVVYAGNVAGAKNLLQQKMKSLLPLRRWAGIPKITSTTPSPYWSLRAKKSKTSRVAFFQRNASPAKPKVAPTKGASLSKVVSVKTKEGTIMDIETVKWSWAAAVQSKNVYRDDEFIRTKTKEEALQAIDILMEKHKGSTYTITVFRDGEYFTYSRHSMPCLGGLVKYRDSHGDRYFMNPYFPRDIRVAYPEGDTIYVACYRSQVKKALETPYFEFCLSPESPWVSAFGSKETIIVKDNYFVLTNMNTDPTVLYSLMRLGGLAYGAQGTKYHPKAQILTFLSTCADPRRLAGQKPCRTSGGTWAEGYGYTRPYNESIFKTSLPCKLPDFGKLPTGGYPNQFPFTNEYFVSTMKKEFGVDMAKVTSTLQITPETEAVLIKAWDYFKEKAKELDE